jgi:cyclomaltodextrinase / maltogenic alpha-amylase / neopullulanase
MIQTPTWAKNAIFYQIFPDRFARSTRTSHPPGLRFKPWGSPPEEQGFQGGDLYGIVDHLDYLSDLGINALYLNPIFASAANHRYHTHDYYQVDPLLGGNPALRELLDEAHRRDIKVVLDGVFNHASRGFWAFHHILETGSNSPYLDWFMVEGWPLRPYQHDASHPHNYKAWVGLPALPEFNTDNPGVRAMIFDIARHWLEFGIDGWRLDVPADIDDDSFWQEFRQVVKGVNPEAYICGEIWWNAQRWLQGDQFDAVMNYLITSPLVSFFGGKTLRPGFRREHLTLRPIDAPEFARDLLAMYDLYDWEINFAQMNMLDSHDMARALWIMGEDTSALKLCILAMMTLPGAPCVYYGDEIGLSADGDPYCRGAFPWEQEPHWDHKLLDHYKAAIALRRGYPVLRTGNFETVYAQDMVYACVRRLEDQAAVVVYNAGVQSDTVEMKLPEGVSGLIQVWPDTLQVPFQIAGEWLKTTIPARDGLVLVIPP